MTRTMKRKKDAKMTVTKFQLIISTFYVVFAVGFFLYPLVFELTLRTTILFGILIKLKSSNYTIDSVWFNK